jgi:hypothetical protein
MKSGTSMRRIEGEGRILKYFMTSGGCLRRALATELAEEGRMGEPDIACDIYRWTVTLLYVVHGSHMVGFDEKCTCKLESDRASQIHVRISFPKSWSVGFNFIKRQG